MREITQALSFYVGYRGICNGEDSFQNNFFFTTRDGTFSINSNGTIMIPTGMPALYILVYLYSTKQLYVFAGG